MEQTISDFGDQWTRYRGNDGYYGSVGMLKDIVEPLLPVEDFAGARVGEIGSGTGRIVRMMLAAGARKIVAVEPSAAFHVLRKNTQADAERIEYVHGDGRALPGRGDLDIVVSIGVLHHIPDPVPVVEQAYRALRPGGRFLAWLYGREGNEAYLRAVEPLRRITTRLPHAALAAITWGLYPPLKLYSRMSHRFRRMPMADYMTSVIDKLSPEAARLVIYDQLNPRYAKYYRREEAYALIHGAFSSVRLHHRHGYSWTVLGRKPS